MTEKAEWPGRATRCEGGGAVQALALHENGQGVAIFNDMKLRWCPVPHGSATTLLEENTVPNSNCTALSPRGDLVARWAVDTVRLWELPAGKERAPLPEPPGILTGLTFDPTGALLAGCGRDGIVHVWHVADGRIPTAKAHSAGPPHGIVQLWHAADGSAEPSLYFPGGTVDALVFSPDGRTLALKSDDGTLRLWPRDGSAAPPGRRYLRAITCLAFSGDGRVLAAGCHDGKVRLWDLPEFEEREPWTTHDLHVSCLAATPDGRHQVTSDARVVRVWRLADGQHLGDLTAEPPGLRCLAISPGGKWLGGGTTDGVVHRWPLRLLLLTHEPIGRTTLDDMALVQETLEDEQPVPAVRARLELLAALMRWRRRYGYDILIEDGGAPIRVGDFDIEIG